MPDENKISTVVTYNDPDDTRKAVTIGGVALAPGEAVDLADFMDQGKAQTLAERLAQNPHFKVEGGPDWDQELNERNRRLFEHEQQINEQRRRQVAARTQDPEVQVEPQAPENYAAPEDNALEAAPTRSRRSRSAE